MCMAPKQQHITLQSVGMYLCFGFQLYHCESCATRMPLLESYHTMQLDNFIRRVRDCAVYLVLYLALYLKLLHCLRLSPTTEYNMSLCKLQEYYITIPLKSQPPTN